MSLETVDDGLSPPIRPIAEAQSALDWLEAKYPKRQKKKSGGTVAHTPPTTGRFGLKWQKAIVVALRQLAAELDKTGGVYYPHDEWLPHIESAIVALGDSPETRSLLLDISPTFRVGNSSYSEEKTIGQIEGTLRRMAAGEANIAGPHRLRELFEKWDQSDIYPNEYDSSEYFEDLDADDGLDAGLKKPDVLAQSEWASDLGEKSASPVEFVEGVLQQGGMSAMYGQSNSGKTFAALHLAASVARGTDWLNRRVLPGLVIYLAAESPASVKSRLQAYMKHHGVVLNNLLIVKNPIRLLQPGDTRLVIDIIAEAMKQSSGRQPMLIIGDTLSRLSAGANENSGEDMGVVVQHVDSIRAKTGAHFMLIHHCGKDLARGMRGWSGVLAALDTEMEVISEAGQHSIEITKQRDLMSKGVVLAFKLKQIELGKTQWDTPLTSCVVEVAQALSKPRQSSSFDTREDVLAKRPILITVFDAVQEFREQGGMMEQAPIDDIYEFAKNKFPAPPRKTPTGKRATDNRKATVQRAIRDLKSDKYAFVNFNLIDNGMTLKWTDGF